MPLLATFPFCRLSLSVQPKRNFWVGSKDVIQFEVLPDLLVHHPSEKQGRLSWGFLYR